MNIENIMEKAYSLGKENEPSKLFEGEFGDSKLLYGDKNRDIKVIAVGIDIESEEIILADRLNKQGANIDLLIAHHPEGNAIYSLHKMVKIQEGLLLKYNGNISSIQNSINKAESKYSKAYTNLNYNRAVNTAELLEIPLINIHTPADNMVHSYLQNIFDNEQNLTLKEIIDILLNEEEYKIAEKDGAGPYIANGTEKNRAGKIVVDMTGGIEADKSMYKILENSNISTILGMHMSNDHLEEAKKHNINVVIAGHMASDTLGMNLLLDEIEKVEKFEKIYEFSGFKRFSRNKK